MMKTVVRLVLGLFVLELVAAGLSRRVRQVDLDSYDSANYDIHLENLNLETQDIYDYEELLPIDKPQIEISTLAPLVDSYQASAASLEEEDDELHPRHFSASAYGVSGTSSASSAMSASGESGESGVPMGPDTHGGLPTCQLCTCLGGSVYCDDLKLRSVPPLPKDTTHFYARYNKITKVHKSDFAQLNNLKKIDLTSNQISVIAEDALSGLPALEELVVRENKMAQLPALPATMNLIDASHNRLGSTGIHTEAFKDMNDLMYLYLTDNEITHIPVPLPNSLRSLHLQNNNIHMMHEDTFCNMTDLNFIRNALEDIRLDGNPINLSKTPQAYICLPRVPVGDLI